MINNAELIGLEVIGQLDLLGHDRPRRHGAALFASAVADYRYLRFNSSSPSLILGLLVVHGAFKMSMTWLRVRYADARRSVAGVPFDLFKYSCNFSRITVVFVYNKIIGLQNRLMYVVKSNTLYIPKYMVDTISTTEIDIS